MHSLRKLCYGYSLSEDRLWKLTDSEGNVYAVTEYNSEITGQSFGLDRFFHYGGNWYYWKSELQRQGWNVEHIEDRYPLEGYGEWNASG